MIVQASASSKSEVVSAGVDLVLRRTGYSILDSEGFRKGVIDSEKLKLRGRERLAFIRDELQRLVIAPKPDIVVVEGFSLMSENRPFDMGMVRCIIELLAHDANILIIDPKPKQLKYFVTASGTASKKRMIADVGKYYGVVTKDDNEADAVGLAKLGYVYLTGDSKRRCELEIVRRLKNPKSKQQVRYKKERIHV